MYHVTLVRGTTPYVFGPFASLKQAQDWRDKKDFTFQKDDKIYVGRMHVPMDS